MLFRMNVEKKEMPRCVTICPTTPGQLPKAPKETDLQLKYIISGTNESLTGESVKNQQGKKTTRFKLYFLR